MMMGIGMIDQTAIHIHSIAYVLAHMTMLMYPDRRGLVVW